MAFDLDIADYPDDAAFWAAAAPHYLTIFQPDEQRLLTSLFPDSAHVDQYGEKAFPYCEAVLVLYAGVVQDTLKLAQIAQTIARPATLARLAGAIVSAGVSLAPVTSRNEAVSRIKEIKRQIIEDGGRASLDIVVADVMGGEVTLPLPAQVSAAVSLMQNLSIGDVCPTNDAGSWAEWTSLVGIDPLRSSRYDGARPLSVLLSLLYRVRMRDDLMLQGTPVYPVAGHEPLQRVVKQLMRWFIGSSLPEPFRNSPSVPSVEAVQEEVQTRMVRASCSTPFELAKFDRSKLCYAIQRYPELSAYFEAGLHSTLLSSCFEELVGSLPTLVSLLPVEAQLKKVSDLLAGYSNLVVSLQSKHSHFEEVHAALVLALSEKALQRPKELEITEDGVTKMQTGGSWHDELHAYVHEAAFCAVENAIMVLLNNRVDNCFKILQLLASLNRAFIWKFLLGKLAVTVKLPFFSEMGKLQYRLHSYMAGQVCRLMPSDVPTGIHSNLASSTTLVFTEAHFKSLCCCKFEDVPWMQIIMHMIASSSYVSVVDVHGSCGCSPPIKGKFSCMICSNQFMSEVRLDHLRELLLLLTRAMGYPEAALTGSRNSVTSVFITPKKLVRLLPEGLPPYVLQQPRKELNSYFRQVFVMASSMLSNVLKLEARIGEMPESFTDVSEQEDTLKEQLEVLSKGAKDRRQYGLEVGLVQAALSASGGFSGTSIPSSTGTLSSTGSIQTPGNVPHSSS